MFDRIEEALDLFKNGQPIIVVDAESRENEGDIIIAAEKATQENVNFCASQGKGLICIAIDETTAKRLDLQPMNSNQQDNFHTAFYDSIDASHQFGITTGISAKERAITAKLITDKASKSYDFIKPGHLFPVVAKENGVLIRAGHTEAGVDLCKITNQYPAAIICEIMQEDGDMMRRDGIKYFAKKHLLKVISIQQIIEYRKKTENFIEQVSVAKLPTQFGNFDIRVFKNVLTQVEHVVIEKNTMPANKPIVRVHSECLTGDAFGSLKCDCQNQLQSALKMIEANGNGFVIYMKNHEGRGIGIGNKIAAYNLQERGFNTFEANEHLGLPADAREYQDAIWILKKLGIEAFDLITNNPKKVTALKYAGFTFQQIQVALSSNSHNKKYLKEKIDLAHHNIILD
ncbi:MAG: 3,4-dihydroxy-2-butanone-4-phosphate synthase [Bacteroidetes bacterium]|nr:3,4-dihydroxy-2-butanone-4-phosphate synthase [Bacteroidota bacterium]